MGEATGLVDLDTLRRWEALCRQAEDRLEVVDSPAEGAEDSHPAAFARDSLRSLRREIVEAYLAHARSERASNVRGKEGRP